MKRIFKTACLLLLCMTMLMSSVLPVSAASYSAKGTQMLKEGKVSKDEAVVINILDYLERNVTDQIDDQLKDLIKDGFGIPNLGNGTVSIVWNAFKGSAYAFYDLGKALNEWRGAKKELLQNIADYYKNATTLFWEYVDNAYQTGKKYANTNTPLHDMSNYNGVNLEDKAFDILVDFAKSIEKAKNDKVFKYSSKCKKQIQEWVDDLYDMANRSPSMQAYYILGRFGTFVVPDYAAFVKADTTCILTSASTGKVLNVSSDASAKKLKNGVKLNVYKYMETDDDTQTFAFIDNGDGSYRIRVSTSKKYLDVYNTNAKKIAKVNAKVQTWDKNTDHWRDQSFKFECEDGYYRILLAADPKYCLYVKSNGNVVLGKTKEGDSSQLWKIIYQD